MFAATKGVAHPTTFRLIPNSLDDILHIAVAPEPERPQHGLAARPDGYTERLHRPVGRPLCLQEPGVDRGGGEGTGGPVRRRRHPKVEDRPGVGFVLPSSHHQAPDG